MNDRNDNNPSDSGRQPDINSPALDMDVLIGRIVDGEASPAQRQRFETLAADDLALWRRLALRQQDMAMLAVHVEPTLNKAEHVELPMQAEGDAVLTGPFGNGASVAASVAGARGSWWLAVSGWAAMIALAVVWGSGIWISHDSLQRNALEGGPADTRLIKATPEDYLQQYMRAPYVLGDMPETMLNVDQLPDGRFAVSYLRRIVEVKYYDSAAEIPLDDEGNFTTSPRQLRHVNEKAPVDPSRPKPRD